MAVAHNGPPRVLMAADAGSVTERGHTWSEARGHLVLPATPRRDAADLARYHDLTKVICLTSAASISPKIRRAVRHIEKNYQHKLTLQSLGAHIWCHPNHRCQKFLDHRRVGDFLPCRLPGCSTAVRSVSMNRSFLTGALRTNRADSGSDLTLLTSLHSC